MLTVIRRCLKMLFSSLLFIFLFLPMLLGIYFAIPKKYTHAKNITLLLFSLLFYSWGEPVYIFLMIYSAFFNYFMANLIGQAKAKGLSAKRNFIFTIAVNLSILSFFKYFGFLMDNINGLFGSNISYTALALPIGISFYTFQALSYVIDIYLGKVKPQKSFLNFALYLALFPQLIAGPIVNYKDIEFQLTTRENNLNQFGYGCQRFLYGLAKKVILANNLGAIHQSVIALTTSESSVVSLWIGIIAYTLQLYFDFSGYSDMAIGLGRMFGFEFLENFDYPYLSRSVTEFWRRWHISLSSWFREYLYIPLGGNRVSVKRHIINLIIVWSLTGLWHGASWNFIIWGLYYGIILILEKYVYGKYLENVNDIIKHIYTMLIVIVGWVFFSSSNLEAATIYLKNMFALGGLDFFNIKSAYLLKTNIIFLIIGSLVAIKIPLEKFEKISAKRPLLGIIFMTGIFIVSISYLVFNSYNPFLYFRF